MIVYSCLFTNNKLGTDQPKINEEDKLPGFEYVMFTNIPEIVKKTGWTPIHKDLIGNHPIYTAKHYKWLAHKYLPNGEIVIFVDSYMMPHKNVNWTLYFKKLNKDDINCGIILMKHPVRGCIYNECDAIASCKKDTRKNMDIVKEFLKEKGMPRYGGLVESGLLVRNLKNDKFNKVCEELFDLMLKYTFRDQALFTYICWKNGVMVNDGLAQGFYKVTGKRCNNCYVDRSGEAIYKNDLV